MKSKNRILYEKYIFTCCSIILGMLAGASVMSIIVYFGQNQNPNPHKLLEGVLIIYGLILFSSLASGMVTVLFMWW